MRATLGAALAVLACGWSFHGWAQDLGGYPNDGQDPTRPRTRLDVRYQYQEAPAGLNGKANHLLILRADRLAGLGGGWLLATRVDLPLAYNDLPSRDTPRGEYRFGASDLLVQGLFIKPVSRTQAFALGGQVIAPTASEDQMGTGKWQLVPTAAYRWTLDERGSFVAGLVRYAFDVAGDDNRRHISELQFHPAAHFNFGMSRFITLWLEPWRYNFRSDKWFIPADVTVGQIINNAMVMSLQASAPLHYDSGYKLYDWKIEARIGFFF